MAWARASLGASARKLAIISNPTVFGLYGENIRRKLASAGFETSVWLMRDGERYKNLASLEQALKYLSDNRLSRDDAVVALGGGVVGDLAGFAAAVHLRGIRFMAASAAPAAVALAQVAAPSVCRLNRRTR